MGGTANGIAFHGGFLPYVGTFLNFSDYMRGCVRLAALSALHVVYVWTHDSIGLGEDGPTHQPVEHYAALRAMPACLFVRPGDPNEAIAAWRLAVAPCRRPRRPRASRARSCRSWPARPTSRAMACDRGGYVLAEANDASGAVVTPDIILLATGSELQLAVAARASLLAEGIRARVVSHAVLGALRRLSPRRIGTRSCRRRSGRASASRPGRPWAGTAGSASKAPSSPSTGSAPRRPRPAIFEHFGFTVAARRRTSPGASWPATIRAWCRPRCRRHAESTARRAGGAHA